MSDIVEKKLTWSIPRVASKKPQGTSSRTVYFCILLSVLLHSGALIAYLYTPSAPRAELAQRKPSADSVQVAFIQAAAATPPDATPPVPEAAAPPKPEEKTPPPLEQRKPVAKPAEEQVKKVEKSVQKLKSKSLPVKTAQPPKKAPEHASRQVATQHASEPQKSAAPVLQQAPGYRSQEENWEGQVLAKLEKEKVYPPAAIRRGDEDVIYVKLLINRAGEIVNFTIVKSKGIVLLNKAVSDMVKRASPLPKLPDTMQGDPYSITVPVNFFLSS